LPVQQGLLPCRQGQPQEFPAGLHEAGAILVKLLHFRVVLEQVTQIDHARQADGAFPGRLLHGFGEIQAQHVLVHQGTQTHVDAIQLVQAHDGDEEDQRKLGGKPRHQAQRPGFRLARRPPEALGELGV